MRRNVFALLSLAARSGCASELTPALRGGQRRHASEWLVPGRAALSLEAADAMATAAVAEAKEKQFKDISVFVVDASGRVLVSKTMINCPPLIPQMAHAKAGAAIGTHSSSRSLKDKYVPDRTPQLLAMTTLSIANSQPFVAVPGGVLCRDGANNVLGAVGVSGASADEDEHCAVVAAQAVGLVTEPASSPLSHSASEYATQKC